MKKKKDMSIASKIALINQLWDKGEHFMDQMPEREMYEIDESNADLFDDVYLDENSSWLLWELEMMED